MKKSWESNQLRLLNRDSESLWDTNVRRLRQYLRQVLCLLTPFFSYNLCQGTDFVSAGEKTLGLVKLWPDPQWPLFHSLSLCRGCFNYASSFWDNTDRRFFLPVRKCSVLSGIGAFWCFVFNGSTVAVCWCEDYSLLRSEGLKVLYESRKCDARLVGQPGMPKPTPSHWICFIYAVLKYTEMNSLKKEA